MNAADIQLNEPPQQRAGMTWKWRREDLAGAGYPASSWTLTYYFKKTGSSGANFSIAASADGDNYAVSVAASTTDDYTAGDYTWVAVVSGGGEAFEVDRGRLKLLARYDAAANLDDRTHARKMLEAIETALETFASNPQMKSYTIGSRSYTRDDTSELLTLRDRYRGEVAAEEMGERLRNGQGGNRLVVRF